MRIGIHGRDFQEKKSSRFLERLLDRLDHYGAELHVSSKFLKHFKSDKFKSRVFDHGHNLKNLDLFISLGGDGTLLESVTYVGKNETPILGVNTGRLGFLATTGREETEEALDYLLAGNYTIEERSMLKLVSDPKLFGGLNFGLNDFTIMKKDTSSMITVHVYVDGELLNSYWADGVIVSTPTGSTGYSLSCGGPLLFPESESFIVTPVSPHNLTVRPIVLSDKSELTFRIEGRSKKFLVSLDSRFETVDETVKLKLKKERFKAHLVQLPGQHYFKTLRQKLNWGLDLRN
ncbi:MAG: NAD kinase [Cyclobacteriaceae bacterium]|jgi:NAD+ kinase|nr:NAD kinase [Cyclobacteriaceae bacterium]